MGNRFYIQQKLEWNTNAHTETSLFIILFMLFLSSCSIVPQTDYTALVVQDRELVTGWDLQETADRLPEASYNISGEKTEVDDESYSDSLSIIWELDVWQKLSDSANAAAMDEAEQQELFLAARDSLAALVMKEWLELIGDQHAVDIEQKRLQILEQNSGYILQRYRNGIGNLEDLDCARSSPYCLAIRYGLFLVS